MKNHHHIMVFKTSNIFIEISVYKDFKKSIHAFL